MMLIQKIRMCEFGSCRREMFPPGVRSKAVGLAIASNWLTNVPYPQIMIIMGQVLILLDTVHCGSYHAENAQVDQFWHVLLLLLGNLIHPWIPKISCEKTLITKTVFCIILLVWVCFCVPETKGIPIEEMDKLFGGNQGEEDMSRVADIRQRLGITSSTADDSTDEKHQEHIAVEAKHIEG